jgi:hypothetical protein
MAFPYNHGMCHIRGDGTSIDVERVVQLLVAASNSGYDKAKATLDKLSNTNIVDPISQRSIAEMIKTS